MSTVITPESQAFIDKWAILFADNELENITEKTFRDFTTDVAALHEQGQYQALLLTASANSAESLIAGKDVKSGRLYAIKGTPDPNDPAGLAGTWNGTGDEQTVYVVGLAPALFASLGCLLDTKTGTTRPVQVDVQAGQYQTIQGGGVALAYTAAPLAATQPVFELSPALAALGKGRLRLLLSPAGATPPPSGGFPYSFPASIP
jgi:hypothetical protein